MNKLFTLPVIPKRAVIKSCFRHMVSPTRNVLIYKNNAKSSARIIGICGFGQWITLSYMSFAFYESMPAYFKWIPQERQYTDNKQKKSNRLPLADWKYRAGFSLFAVSASTAIFLTSVMYCFRKTCNHSRSKWVSNKRKTRNIKSSIVSYMGRCSRTVSSLTLLRNSNNVLITTYTPLGTKRSFVESVENISAMERRSSSLPQLPLKVRNRPFHFLLDKQGEFLQGGLFDRTIGIRRTFK